jgi:hypothetical protein
MFRSQEWRFQVKLPGTPQQDSKAIGNDRVCRFSVGDKDGEFSVLVRDAPNPFGEPEEITGRYFDEWRDNAIKSMNGKLANDSAFRLEDRFPGREFVIQLSSMNAKQRVIVVLADQTTYVLMAMGKPNWTGWKRADDVFSSFRVLP